jgi:hypothetical protein
MPEILLNSALSASDGETNWGDFLAQERHRRTDYNYFIATKSSETRFAFARASRARENSPGASVSALFSYWFKAIANENISMPTRTLGDVRIVTGSGRDHIMYHKARSVGSQHYALHGTRPDA